jgi:sialate O-acetylesterase
MKTAAMNGKIFTTATVLVLLLSATPLLAEVQLTGLFNDHMVLQREMKVPVWGTASPGEKVIVRFAGQTVSTQAGPDGKWRVRLPPMKAAEEPRTLTVAGANTIEVKDVLVGEVWVCSGQSNMELTPPKGLIDPEPEIAAAHWPKIRMNLVEKTVAEKPLSDLEGSWAECTPEMMRRFSAAGYFFGREIHQKVGVPIGLIGAYYGGSNGQSWMRREAFESDPDLKKYVAQLPPPGTNAPVPLRPSSGGGPASRYRPANFYNGMIAPLIPFAIRGVIWYQGEANTANARDAGLYARLFSTMIKDWRKQWGQGDFPFFFVQLPTSEPGYPDPTDSAWARVRESQQQALAVKHTAMVVTLDIGEGAIVHAHNKKNVGLRLAATALNKVYHRRDVACEGPIFRGMKIKGSQAVLSFDNASGGLVCKNPNGLKGFAIAGADQNFVWAEAKIEGSKVVVSSPQVKAPVAVRYAWADNPEVSLFNQAGLPAAPLRTDDWPAVKITNPRAAP